MSRRSLSSILSADDTATMDDAYKQARHDYAADLLDVIENDLVGFYTKLIGERPKKVTTKEARWFALNGNSGVSVVLRRGSKYGSWHSFADAKGGGPFQAIKHYRHATDWPDVLDEAADMVGFPRFDPTVVRKSVSEQFQKEREEKARKRAEKEREAAANQSKQEDEEIRAEQPHWDRAVDVVGTIGETYLQNARGINLGGDPVRWPTSVRWSVRERALIFKVEDTDGQFVGYQYVAVTYDGRQDKTRYGAKIGAKKSKGKIGRGFVRFQGQVDGGPIFYCEGPETGLSVWITTGHEVRVMLGSGGFRRIKNYHPKDRTAILCRDDDRVDNAAYKSAVAALYELAALGFDACEAWAFERREFEGADFNDLMQQSGGSAVAQRVNEALTKRHDFERDEYSIEQAAKILEQRVLGLFNEAKLYQSRQLQRLPVMAIGCDTAGGKTRVAIKALVDFGLWLRERGDYRSVVFLAPERMLTSQIARDIRAEAQRSKVVLKVVEYRGMGSPKANAQHSDDLMCEQYDVVKDATALCANIEKEICGVCPHRLVEDEGGGFRGGCAYQRQQLQRADIWVGAHALLNGDVPNCIAGDEDATGNRPGIALLIIDEDIVPTSLTTPFKMHAALLDDGQMPLPDNEAKAETLLEFRWKAGTMIRSEPEGFLRLSAFRREETRIDYLLADAAVGAEWSRKIGPKKEKDPFERHENATLRDAISMAESFADLAAPSRGLTGRSDVSGQIFIGRDKKTKSAYARIAKRHSIAPAWRVPTLILDAMIYDGTALKEIFPTVRFEGRINIEAPHQRIIQVVNRSFSMKQMDPTVRRGDDGSSPDDAPGEADAKPQAKTSDKERQRAEAARRNCADVVAVIVREHLKNLAEHPKDGPGSLVIACKAAAREMKKLIPKGLKMDFCTYGRTSGRNEWEKVRNVFIVGRPMPKPLDAEMQAAAFFNCGVETLKAERGKPFSGWYQPSPAYRISRRKGELIQSACETFVHPDGRVEFMRWRACEAAVMQAIGRGRGARRTASNPLDVHVFTDVVLPYPVDEFVLWEDVAPSVRDKQIAAGGIVFETDGAACAAALYKDRWPSANAFHNEIDRERERLANSQGYGPNHPSIRPNSYKNLYKETGECSPEMVHELGNKPDLPSFRFKLKGEGRHSITARWCPSICPDPRAEIEAVLVDDEIVEFIAEAPALPPPQPARVGRIISVFVNDGFHIGSSVDAVEDVGEPIAFEVWERLWLCARDRGLSYDDVAQYFGLTLHQLKIIELRRRPPPRWLEGAVESFIAGAAPQGRPLVDLEVTACAS